MSHTVAIIGGGLAGAAAACRLAGAGSRVVLLERERLPHHKVCGEFVSVEALRHLEALAERPAGSLLASLGAAPIQRVRLASGRHEAVAALPFQAWGLSRRRLDAWLLGEAERRGVGLRRGLTVRSLATDGEGVRLETSGEQIRAGAAVLATGKHELRGRPRAATPSRLIGLKMHLRLDPEQARALDGHVELALFPGGYAGLQRIEGGEANLCLVVTKERFASLGRDWRQLVLAVPHLARRLAGGAASWDRPLAIYGIPYGYQHRERDGTPVYRVGDQLAVIPSFTGEGMAIALRSGLLAADAIRAGQPADAFHREAARTFRGPLRIAALAAWAAGLPPLQDGLTRLCGLAPGLMAQLARLTRTRTEPAWGPP